MMERKISDLDTKPGYNKIKKMTLFKLNWNFKSKELLFLGVFFKNFYGRNSFIDLIIS